MGNNRTTLIKRLVFLGAAFLAIGVILLINFGLNKGADGSAGGALSGTESEDSALSGVTEMTGLPKVVRLTFGGDCTVGAALGTTSFGTFNQTVTTEGEAYFLSGLKDLFAKDDLTVLGCSAILTDQALSVEGVEGKLPYLGASKNAEIFSLSSVELLSFANEKVAACGWTGLTDTKAAAEEAGLAWTDDENAYYFEVGGLRIAVLGASAMQETAGETIAKRASIVSETCDYVVVYAERTAGAEEHYDAIARQAIDAGADFVCYVGANADGGVATAQTYQNGIIVNSLGTLIDGGAIVPSDTALFTVALTVENGVITQVEGELLPIASEAAPWQPQLK